MIFMHKRILKTIVGFTLVCAIVLLSGLHSISASEKKFNMSYIYFGNANAYISHVNDTRNSLNEISPNYFNLDMNGNLVLTAIDINFINEMHSRDIKVVPFLSNHWDREKGRAALKNRAKLVTQIADAIEAYNLDGINVDIENMTQEDRNDYTDFVRMLNAQLPPGKIIAVAVAPNPYGVNKGWQGSYDYASLAKYSDYLMIMAYDEHYQGGSPGPVASLPFVEKSIKYALERVPKDKIVLGIPFYGRYWKNEKSYGGYGVSNYQIDELVYKYNGKVELDVASYSPKAVITIKNSDVKPYILGRQLDAGTYTFWYENEESIRAKLELVKKYDIKGTGSWSLGQESNGTWDYYKLYLNGYTHRDIGGHWAQEYMMSIIDRGWMKGISNNLFAPNTALTRGEAAVILVRALELQGKSESEESKSNGNKTAECKTNQSEEVENKATENKTTEYKEAENKAVESKVTFSDISKHWASTEIQIAAQNGLVLGREDGRFYPDDKISRQEMAVMLDRLLNLPESENKKVPTNPYKDITSKKYSWSYDSIIKLTKHSLFTGDMKGNFLPLDNITRAEMVHMFWEQLAVYSREILKETFQADIDILEEFDFSCNLMKHLPSMQQISDYLYSVLSNILNSIYETSWKNTPVIIRQIILYIRENACSNDMSLKRVAEKFYLNPSYLSRIFKEKTGITFWSYVTDMRLEKAKEMLKNDCLSLNEIALQCGLNSVKRLHAIFKMHLGCTPGEFRKQLIS
jgi:spore germination protein YaaH/AraC-like DNA-binding protein